MIKTEVEVVRRDVELDGTKLDFWTEETKE